MRFSVKITTTITMFFLLVFLATAAFAGIATTINYQGRLEGSGGGPINGTVSMTFAIYNAPSGGSALWTETQSSVTVTGGAFSVSLGSVTPITNLLFDEPYYLGVAVNGDAEMSPRAAFQTVPYAARAVFAEDADTLDEMEAAEIIDAASDEVRTPISSVPYTIDTPGSYYLTGDLNVVSSNAIGITVNADNVTIDLMGFMINGPGSGNGIGIYMDDRRNVEIRNGTVRGFGQIGIGEFSLAGKGHRVINVRVNYNGTGIYLMGSDGGHLVQDVTALGNTDIGIRVYNGATVADSVAAENGHSGIETVSGSTVTGNTVFKNGQWGIRATSDGNTVTGNNASYNGSIGIEANQGNTVTGNTASHNGGYGIYASSGCTVSGNTASGNGKSGIHPGPVSAVIGNTAFWNQEYGIDFDNNSLVDGNAADNNNQSGGSYTNMSACPVCTFGTNHAP